jgi:general secretion pathway protein D
MFRHVLIISLLMSLIGSALAADRLRMNMRDADIRALIQWVADNTDRNIIVHKDVRGTVTVMSSDEVSPEQAYQVFLSVLDVHGYAAIETEQAVKIVPKNIAKSGLPLEGSAQSDMVVSIIALEYLTASNMAALIRPLISQAATLAPSDETNSIIIADHRSNIVKLRQLITQLDRADSAEIELLRLNNANAADILASIKALVPNSNAGISLSMDERSNTILLSGDPARRARIRNLVEQLDTPLNGQGNTQVIYLHYVDASELVPILKSVADAINTDNNERSSVSIESSESANALVINAPPAMLTTMKRVIDQLDIRRAQVLVEALVVEVSGDVASDIGVSWITENTADVNNGVVGAVNALGDLGLGSINDSGTFIPSRGLTFGYFEDGDLLAAVRALEATQNTNVLSTPTVVAIDNEEASLLVGQNVPFKTGESTSAASSTSDPFTTIERQDIGTSLIITPRINRGDSITLEIKQKTESIAPSVQLASDIITNKREILTKALIKDGQTLVLGGLISDEETEVEEKVPFLGDIPLMGRLFRSTGTDHRKTNLMVFIHPVILKDEEHISQVTQQRYQFMQSLREKAISNDWSVAGEDELGEFSRFAPANKPNPASNSN